MLNHTTHTDVKHIHSVDVASPQIGGLTPLTTIDFPEHLSAVIFCQGCSWRCGYCHNPHLISRNVETDISWHDIQLFLEQRQKFLDGVVFSGGEPLLQRQLPEMVSEVVDMGFDAALHTTGSIPSRFKTVLPELTWVGFDIKGSSAHYEEITGVANSERKALESLEHLLSSEIDYEVRTTVDPELLNEDDVLNLATNLQMRGVKHYVLQQCRSINTKPSIDTVDLRPDSVIATQLEKQFETFSIRTF